MKTQMKHRISKRMSYWLRHQPERAGLTLDEHGWVEVPELIEAFNQHGQSVDRDILNEVVATNDKKRFEFDDKGQRIRARQGHSVSIELGYEPTEPPEWLFHGTASRNIESIEEKGLHKAGRHHVHLSTDTSLMLEVARRHGRPVLVKVAAGKMHAEGFEFFLTGNGVWLTDAVPPEYLEVVELKN